MKTFNKYLILTLGALVSLGLPSSGQEAPVKSDIQAYPGVQFRVEQSFIDLISDEFWYELPYIINDVLSPLIPKDIRLALGFVQIHNIYAKDFQLDTTRAKFTIDEKQRGIMMNWAAVKNWHIHFEVWYVLFWPLEYSFKVDMFVKNGLLDNGLSLQADTHTGAPQVNFFNT